MVGVCYHSNWTGTWGGYSQWWCQEETQISSGKTQSMQLSLVTWAGHGFTLTVSSFPASTRESRQLTSLTATGSKAIFSTQLIAAAMESSVTEAAHSCHFTGSSETLKGIMGSSHQAVINTTRQVSAFGINQKLPQWERKPNCQTPEG